MKSVAYDSYLEGEIELQCDTAENVFLYCGTPVGA
jgi:hypothetical protein